MIPFTEQIYWNHFALYYDAIWPIPLMAILLGVASLALLPFSSRWFGLGVSTFLAAQWFWTGGVYFWLHYGQLVWAAPVFAVVFFAQGALVAWSGIGPRRLEPEFRKSLTGWLGIGLCILALCFGPLIGPDWKQSPLFGVTPAPVALYSLGIVLLNEHRGPFYLLPIPLLWMLWDATTLWVIG